MAYETALPSMHLDGESIVALEELLLEESTDPELEITLDHGRVAYRYSSAETLVGDVAPPALVRSFQVRLTAREGRIELRTARQDQEITLSITGEGNWAESRGRRIESFFETHGSIPRTLLERYMAIGLTLVAIVAALGIHQAGFGGVIGMRTPVDALLYGSIAAFGGGIMHILLNVVYPYALVVTRSGVPRLPVSRRDGPADP